MSTEIKGAVDSLHNAFHEFKSTHKELVEAQVKGSVDVLLKDKIDRINEALTKSEEAIAVAEKAQALAQSSRAVETALTGMSSKELEAKKALFAYVAKGENGLTEKQRDVLMMETKRLSSGSDTAGGYTVVPEMDREITRLLNETSPMRQLARVISISTDQYEKLAATDAGAVWIDREDDIPETGTPTFRKMVIRAHKLGANAYISQDLLEDSIINMEQFLLSAISDSMELLENRAFIHGDGVGMPRGILDMPAGTGWGQIEQIASGSATGVTYQSLFDLVYSLKDGYLTNAKWLMNRSSVKSTRLITDSQGNLLWVPGFGTEPSTLLGYPIVRAADMPGIGAGALPIAFGDFRRAYTIVDRSGTRLLRDPYTTPHVRFAVTKRVGGGCDNTEAVKILKVSV